MASQLTDEELREKLVEFGEDVGPFTATTRPLWEKRLKTLMREKRRSPVRNLNAFSSDDSEIDSNDTHRLHRKKRNSYRSTAPVINLGRLELNNKHSGGTASQVSTDVFKKPTVPSPRGGTSHNFFSNSNIISGKLPDSISRSKGRKSLTSESLNATFDVDTSDSDFDSESPTFTRLSPRLRNRNCTEDRNGDHRNFYSQHKSKGDSNAEKNDSFLRKVINVPVRKESYTPFAERWSSRSTFERRHDKPSVNGYVSVDSVLNKEFPDGKVPGKTTNYSHCVSWMLVLGTAAFFILIGTVYMSEVQKVSQNLTKNNYLSLCCKEEHEDMESCIPKQYLKPALHISRELHSLLAAVAGEYECKGETGTSRSKHMTIPDVVFILKAKILDQSIIEEFDRIFVYALWLIWKHPGWQIIFHWTEENYVSRGNIKDFHHISALESVVAAKTFWCRIQHSIQWTTTELAILVLVVISLLISINAVKYWKRRKEVQEREMYDLVEKIIETLQKQDEGCELGSNSAAYKAVVHVRDMLIPPEERKSKQWLWDKAVNFIEENESRIRVEERHIAGEGFKVWRWLSNSAAEGEGGRHGKVWQGQAFRNLGKGCPYGATPCLKIRNMFDPEVEYGDDWQICIQDAILEKCEGNNGIVHIAVDPTPSEGCVYLMCNSSEAAGKAFNALHGWWFDGKLVTVKYLRLERYLERFPAAEYCVEPLKPSNNERLSLSAPFFSSALERS